ncbi:hypothetical protein [Labilibacter marinus]|uniref:hypothetical protein n=1 Tax=Labilibacter marinus TaxID=1477105 RepID=UPI00094F7080|nr:hypothetical protein [Labilibacter marinus]
MSRKEWTDDKLFFRLLNNKSDKTYWDNISELRSRPNKSVFEKCKDLVNSDNTKKRMIGIDILAQLGTSPRPFYNETMELYFDVVEKERDSKVLKSLLYAIGHNNDNVNQEQIEKLIAFKTSESSEVRQGLVSSLLGLDNNQAIDTLIDLSNDKVATIRNWATFGIGSQIETDNDKIRNALWSRTSDKNQDTKLEAIVGLANRNDIKVKEIIKQEFINGEYGMLLFEAIELLDCVELIPLLNDDLNSGKNHSDVNQEWLKDLETLIDKLEKKEKRTAL